MCNRTRSILVVLSLTLIMGCQSSPVETIEPELETVQPVAIVHSLDPQQTSLQFLLEFTSNTESVEILVKSPGNDWTSIGLFSESPVTFIAQSSGRHEFIGLAVDVAGNIQPIPEIAQAETEVPEPIIITDRQGEDFDITNAVLRYQMTAYWWDHGLGRNTIRPINDPQFVLPGDVGYPRSNATTTVIGLDIQDNPRGYPIYDIANREVVNDVMGNVHFAATF